MSSENEYYISPTHDFVMELLSLGKEVKVLEPESLKQEMIRKFQEALELYK